MKAPKSDYKGVHGHYTCGKYLKWRATLHINGNVCRKDFSTERAAAVQYDKMCIEHGLEPVNILTRREKDLISHTRI